MLIRPPAVAGTFYPSDPEELIKLIEWSFTHPIGPGELPKVSEVRERRSVGFMVPHAGYIYSGPVAAWSYYKLAQEGPPELVIILGPNHTGIGSPIAAMPPSIWETPLGHVHVDPEATEEIVKESGVIDVDPNAHMYEHSLEVQVPFLQYLFGDRFRIVAIAMGLQTPEAAKAVADGIYRAMEKLGKDYVVLASSDLNHYEPHEITVKKDMIALEKITQLDTEGLYKALMEYDISMCGPGPVMTVMELTKKYDGDKGILLKHATSGDTSGDYSQVVGYASVQFPLP